MVEHPTLSLFHSMFCVWLAKGPRSALSIIIAIVIIHCVRDSLLVYIILLYYYVHEYVALLSVHVILYYALLCVLIYNNKKFVETVISVIASHEKYTSA